MAGCSLELICDYILQNAFRWSRKGRARSEFGWKESKRSYDRTLSRSFCGVQRGTWSLVDWRDCSQGMEQLAVNSCIFDETRIIIKCEFKHLVNCLKDFCISRKCPKIRNTSTSFNWVFLLQRGMNKMSHWFPLVPEKLLWYFLTVHGTLFCRHRRWARKMRF